MNPELVGISFAVGGSVLSIVGTMHNNINLDHRMAMIFWMVSNPLLLIWGMGYSLRIWNGGLSGWALAGMYLVFTITNFYGLFLKKKMWDEVYNDKF
jgi:hypothetical protein